MLRGDEEIFNCELSLESYTSSAWPRAKLMELDAVSQQLRL